MPSLYNLPYEILQSIIMYLSLEDILRLALVHRELYDFVYSDRVAKLCLKDLNYCSELQSGLPSDIDLVPTLRTIVKRKDAAALAKPFSIAMLAESNHFIYMQRTLSYVHNSSVRVLGLQGTTTNELVVSISDLLTRTVFQLEKMRTRGVFQLLCYGDGIISFLYTIVATARSTPNADTDPKGYLIALKLSNGTVLLCKEIRKLLHYKSAWARISDTGLVFGILEKGTINQLEWAVSIYDLGKGKFVKKVIKCRKLLGQDVGTDVSFEIVDGIFYAVSVEARRYRDAIDRIEFYDVVFCPVQFSLDGTGPETVPVFRRFAVDGAVDHRFDQLSIVRDEMTGAATIMDTRKEWLGLNQPVRTVYKTAISIIWPPPDVKVYHSRESARRISKEKSTSEPRPEESIHTEGRRDEITDRTFKDSDVLYRSYNASASSYIDLVHDLKEGDENNKRTRLRLDVAAKHRATLPLKQRTFGTLCKTTLHSGSLMRDSYNHDAFYQWPPFLSTFEKLNTKNEYAAWQMVDSIMNPAGYTGKLTGISDDHGLIYSIRGANGMSMLVLINFDPSLHLHGLAQWKDLLSGKTSDSSTPAAKTRGLFARAPLCERTASSMNAYITIARPRDRSEAAEEENSPPSLYPPPPPPVIIPITTKPAMFTLINRGVEFAV